MEKNPKGRRVAAPKLSDAQLDTFKAHMADVRRWLLDRALDRLKQIREMDAGEEETP